MNSVPPPAEAASPVAPGPLLVVSVTNCVPDCSAAGPLLVVSVTNCTPPGAASAGPLLMVSLTAGGAAAGPAESPDTATIAPAAPAVVPATAAAAIVRIAAGS